MRPPRVGRDEDALEVVVAALEVVVAALVVVVALGLGADFFGARLYLQSQLLSLSGPINLWSGKNDAKDVQNHVETSTYPRELVVRP